MVNPFYGVIIGVDSHAKRPNPQNMGARPLDDKEQDELEDSNDSEHQYERDRGENCGNARG